MQLQVDEQLLKRKARASALLSALFFATVSAVLAKLIFGTEPFAARSLLTSMVSAVLFGVFWYFYYSRQVRAALARRATEPREQSHD